MIAIEERGYAMQTQSTKQGDYALSDQLPIGFFLTGNEEENLRFAFEAPELIRQAAGAQQPRERHLAVRPLIVTGLVVLGIAAGIWQGFGGI